MSQDAQMTSLAKIHQKLLEIMRYRGNLCLGRMDVLMEARTEACKTAS